MNRPEIHHRLETIINSTGGREYTVTVRGRGRNDGRWEGMLEFSPVGTGGRVVTTPVQTTQSSVRQLLYWAGGLSRTHMEDSLMSALYPVRRPAPPPAVRSTIAAIERDSLAMFHG